MATKSRPAIYWLAVIAAAVAILLGIGLLIVGSYLLANISAFAGIAIARWAHQYEPPTRPAKRTRPRTNR